MEQEKECGDRQDAKTVRQNHGEARSIEPLRQ